MADPILDPTTNAGQGTNPPAQTASPTNDIFGGPTDIFDNPNMFTAAPQTHTEDVGDFSFNFDHLQAAQNTSDEVVQNPSPVEPVIMEPVNEQHINSEPVIIEPTPPPQITPEPKSEPVIIDHEEIKDQIYVPSPQPRQKQGTVNSEQGKVNKPKPEQTKPQIQNLESKIQNSSSVVEPQIKAGVKVNPWKPDRNEERVSSTAVNKPQQTNSPSREPRPATQNVVVEPQIEKPKNQNTTVVEPQIKAGVKVNPRSKGTVTSNQGPVTPQQNKPQQTNTPTREPRPATQPVSQPKPEVKVQAPVQEVNIPEITPENIPETKPQQTNTPTSEPRPATQNVVVEPEFTPPPKETIEVKPSTDDRSDLKKKFDELVQITQKIYTLEKKDPDSDDSGVEVLGADNDKITILYQFTLEDGNVFIKKIETDKSEDEEIVNDLGFVFNEDSHSVEIILDDVLLFDEVEHLQDDQKKKMQVSEKINKFIFLLGEHFKKAEKEAKEKEEAENERRRLQDIFRNF